MGAPLVTVGVPVYNASRYLRKTLDSLLGQTYPALEIIVSDNASTDRSHEICEEYAAKDSRIKLFRQQENIGANRNWNFVARKGRGQYFKWAAAQDICAPAFIERCVDVLERRSDVVLCYTETTFIDRAGQPQGTYDDPLVAGQLDPVERLPSVLGTLALASPQSGVIRYDCLRKTGLEGFYRGGDVVLLAELSLYGAFVRLEENLFFWRASPDAFSKGKSVAEVRRIIDPKGRKRFWLDKWQAHLELMGRTLRSDVAVRQKAALLVYIARRMIWNRNTLVAELKEGARTLLRQG